MKETKHQPGAARVALSVMIVAFAGLLVWIGLLLFEEFVTADMRWGLWIASAALAALGLAVGARRLGFWAPCVLAAPLVALHGVPIARDLSSLWPFVPLWAASAIVGWWWTRDGGRPARWAAALLLVGLVEFGGWAIPSALSAAINEYTDEPAPEIELAYLDGSAYPMGDLAGKVVVLDFFATWCIPCRAELPELQAVRTALADREDIVILVVGDGDSGDTPEQVADFARSSDLDLPFVWDPEGAAHDAFEFTNIPALAVIDRQGRVRLKRVGYNAAEIHFGADLEKLLREL